MDETKARRMGQVAGAVGPEEVSGLRESPPREVDVSWSLCESHNMCHPSTFTVTSLSVWNESTEPQRG